MCQINKLWIKLFCQKIGFDQFGNFYYLGKNKDYLGRNKRYVLYNGIEESSKIPPMWHSWLHYMSDDFPDNDRVKNYNRQKDYSHNPKGTKYAHQASRVEGKKLKNYSPWVPKY